MSDDSILSKYETGNEIFLKNFFTGCISFILILLFHYSSLAQEITELSKAGIHIILHFE